MDKILVSAKTLEEAITSACVELGVTSDMLDYEVVTKGSNGIMGFGAKNWEISAGSLAAAEPEENTEKKKASERKREKTEKSAPKGEAVFDMSDDAGNTPEKSAHEKEKSEGRKKQGKQSRKPRTKEKGDEKAAGSRDGKDEPNKSKKRPEKPERADKSSRRGQSKPPVLTEDPAKRASGFLAGVFEGMGVKCDFTAEYMDETGELRINIYGDDVGILIGKRGQTLDALQYLTGQAVNKHQTGYVRVKLDTENYRERRKETLETFAKSMADKARSNKKPVVLEPMNAYERRIVHSVLQAEEDVTTRSEGEEPYRHVVICPAKKKNL